MKKNCNDKNLQPRDSARRFNRTQRTTSRSRSLSSKSDASPLSKFYTKKLAQRFHLQNPSSLTNQLFQKTIGQLPCHLSIHPQEKNKLPQTASSLNILEKTRSPTQNKLQTERLKTYTSDFNEYNERKFEDFSRAELEQTIHALGEQLLKAKNQNNKLSVENSELKNMIGNRKNVENGKTIEKYTIKNIRQEIADAKFSQIKQENAHLKQKIMELEKTIDDLKLSASSIMKNSCMSSMSQDSLQFVKDICCEDSLVFNGFENQAHQQLEFALKQAKIQITRLHLHYNSELRKVIQEKQKITEKKEHEYQELKKKFMEYLRKYSTKPKKNSSIVTKQKLVSMKASCKNLQDSLLDLSSDQEQAQK